MSMHANECCGHVICLVTGAMKFVDYLCSIECACVWNGRMVSMFAPRSRVEGESILFADPEL